MNELWRQKRPRSDQIGSSGADGGEKRSKSGGAPATLQVRVKKEEPGVQVAEEKGLSWVGMTFQKHFPGYGHFQGRIVKYLAEDDLYCVEYDDGDAEELEEYEMRRLLVRVKQENPQQSDKATVPATLSTKQRIQNQPGAKPKGKTAVGREEKSSAPSWKKEQVKERKPGEAQPGWKEMGYSDLDRLLCGPGTLKLVHNSNFVFRRTVKEGESVAEQLQSLAQHAKRTPGANPKITGFIKVLACTFWNDQPLPQVLKQSGELSQYPTSWSHRVGVSKTTTAVPAAQKGPATGRGDLR